MSFLINHGAPVINRKILFWNRCMMKLCELKAHSQVERAYVWIGQKVSMYSNFLFDNEREYLVVSNQ